MDRQRVTRSIYIDLQLHSYILQVKTTETCQVVNSSKISTHTHYST